MAATLTLFSLLFSNQTLPIANAAEANCPNGYVGLTFDDGSTPGNTTNLLNALKQAGLRATMFNLGSKVQNNASLVQQQVSAGMWIGNHSYTHPNMTTLSTSQMQSRDYSDTASDPIRYGIRTEAVPSTL